MTDQPVDSNPTDEPGAPPPTTPPTADEPTTEPGAEATASTAPPVPTSRRPADRMQQILTASVLLLIAASAVLLAIAIANR